MQLTKGERVPISVETTRQGKVSLIGWFEWAAAYARAAGLDPGPCPYRIQTEPCTLLEQDEILCEGEDVESLLAVAEWYAFFDWARELTEQYLICHAAVLERGGRAILLVGKSGAGKSTVALALVRRGFNYLGDEFAVVSPQTLEILPFPKALCLKDSTNLLSTPRDPHFDLIPYPADFSRHYKDLVCCLPRKQIVPTAGSRFPISTIILMRGKKRLGPPVTAPRWRGSTALYQSCWWRNGEDVFRMAAALARTVEFWELGWGGLDELTDGIERITQRDFAAA